MLFLYLSLSQIECCSEGDEIFRVSSLLGSSPRLRRSRLKTAIVKWILLGNGVQMDGLSLLANRKICAFRLS